MVRADNSLLSELLHDYRNLEITEQNMGNKKKRKISDDDIIPEQILTPLKRVKKEPLSTTTQLVKLESSIDGNEDNELINNQVNKLILSTNKKRKDKVDPKSVPSLEIGIGNEESLLTSHSCEILGLDSNNGKRNTVYAMLKDRNLGWHKKIALAKYVWSHTRQVKLPFRESVIIDCLTSALANPKKLGIQVENFDQIPEKVLKNSKNLGTKVANDASLIWEALAGFLNSDRIKTGSVCLRLKPSLVSNIVDSLRQFYNVEIPWPTQVFTAAKSIVTVLSFLSATENTELHYMLLQNSRNLFALFEPLLKVVQLVITNVSQASHSSDTRQSFEELLDELFRILLAVVAELNKALPLQPKKSGLLFQCTQNLLRPIAFIALYLKQRGVWPNLVAALRHCLAHYLFGCTEQRTALQALLKLKNAAEEIDGKNSAKKSNEEQLIKFFSCLSEIVASLKKVDNNFVVAAVLQDEARIGLFFELVLGAYKYSLVNFGKTKVKSGADSTNNAVTTTSDEPGVLLCEFTEKLVQILFDKSDAVSDSCSSLNFYAFERVVTLLGRCGRGLFSPMTNSIEVLGKFLKKSLHLLLEIVESEENVLKGSEIFSTSAAAFMRCVQTFLRIEPQCVKDQLERILVIGHHTSLDSNNSGSALCDVIQTLANMKQLDVALNAYLNVVLVTSPSFAHAQWIKKDETNQSDCSNVFSLSKVELEGFAAAFELAGPMQLENIANQLVQKMTELIGAVSSTSPSQQVVDVCETSAKCLQIALLLKKLSESVTLLRTEKCGKTIVEGSQKLCELIYKFMKKKRKQRPKSDDSVESKVLFGYFPSVYIILEQAALAIVLLKCRYFADKISDVENKQLQTWQSCNGVNMAYEYWSDISPGLLGFEATFSLAAQLSTEEISNFEDVKNTCAVIVQCFKDCKRHRCCGVESGCTENFCPAFAFRENVLLNYAGILFVYSGTCVLKAVKCENNTEEDVEVVAPEDALKKSAQGKAAADISLSYAIELLRTSIEDKLAEETSYSNAIESVVHMTQTSEKFGSVKNILECLETVVKSCSTKFEEKEATCLNELNQLSKWLCQKFHDSNSTLNEYKRKLHLLTNVAVCYSDSLLGRTKKKTIATKICRCILSEVFLQSLSQCAELLPKLVFNSIDLSIDFVNIDDNGDQYYSMQSTVLSFLDAFVQSDLINRLDSNASGLVLGYAATVKLLPRSDWLVKSTSRNADSASSTVLTNLCERVHLFEDTFEAIYNLLNTMLTHHPDTVRQMIASFLSLFLNLVSALMCTCSQLCQLCRFRQFVLENGALPNESFQTSLTAMARLVSRLCFLMHKQLQDCAKSMPFIVASFVEGIQTNQIPIAVRQQLINGLYCLMDMCDKYGIAMLHTNTNNTLLRTLYDDYVKYYKYKGFV